MTQETACNWHFITDEYDGPHQAVDISVERRGLVVTVINVDANKFKVRTEGDRIILERRDQIVEWGLAQAGAAVKQ